MPSHVVTTATQSYTCTVQNGISSKIRDFLPPNSGKVFVVTTPDVHVTQAPVNVYPAEVTVNMPEPKAMRKTLTRNDDGTSTLTEEPA